MQLIGLLGIYVIVHKLNSWMLIALFNSFLLVNSMQSQLYNGFFLRFVDYPPRLCFKCDKNNHFRTDMETHTAAYKAVKITKANQSE